MNCSPVAQTIRLPFPDTGKWLEALQGRDVMVEEYVVEWHLEPSGAAVFVR